MSFQYADYIFHPLPSICVHADGLVRDESTGTICHCFCHQGISHINGYEINRLTDVMLSIKTTDQNQRKKKGKIV
ncbi:MAG: hypothetical protein NUV91_05300 [Candidatus Omnitrophica bacterium]|nr:hypothetical protein [Candidatus Omnitrophota bacterium]